MPPKRRRRANQQTQQPAGFAERLREIISGRALTAYAVAHSAGVAPSVVSRFLSGERGVTLATFDAVAGALGLRLVEGGRPKGRPSRSPSKPVDAPEGEGPEAMPAGLTGSEETGPKLDKLDTRPGPDALHCLSESDAIPGAAPTPDGPAAATTDDATTPAVVCPEAASIYAGDTAGTIPEEAGPQAEGAKWPVVDVVGCPTEAFGHMVMDDDGGPPVSHPPPAVAAEPSDGYWRFPIG